MPTSRAPRHDSAQASYDVMPPADLRFDKTKADYWRGRSEEARVFAESMGHNEPKAIMLRIATEYEMIARWCEELSKPTESAEKNLGQGSNYTAR